MKSFKEFIAEAYDPELEGQASREPGEGGRIRSSRKKRDIDKKRVKVVGGGKTAPAQDYKDRKDIGTNKPRSRYQQQPTQDKGVKLSAREQQRKAAKERRAAKSGVKAKSADELLSTKKKSVDPKYKPTGKQGYGGASKKSYSHQERHALRRKGEKTLRDLRLKNLGKKSEKELKHKIVSK